MTDLSYTEINAKTIDSWVEAGWEWGTPISPEEYAQAVKGKYDVLLTPSKYVPKEWFPELRGKKLLGLACGGGQQMPIFAALGADCTVLDYSGKQLANEKYVAEREGYKINIVNADMTKRLPFENDTFDLIFHPVANCYIENVYHVWDECYRVLKKGGRLLAGVGTGINYLFDDIEKSLEIVNKLPFNPLKNKDQMEKLEKSNDGIQFSHTLEEQIGGQLNAGFILKHLYEDHDRVGLLREYNIPVYIATMAVK